jgi:putative heme degradation protein
MIKLRKANQGGEAAGVLYVSTEQIVAISAGQRATELQMSDGHTLWALDAVEEVVSLVRNSG